MNNVLRKHDYGKQAWVVVFTASLFAFYSFVLMNMFNSLSSDLVKAFSLSASQIGKMSSTYFWACVFFLFPAGMLLDRYSSKKLILMSFGLYLLSTIGFGLSQSVLMCEIMRFLMGAASTFWLLSAVRLASRWFLPKRMALVMGLVITIAMSGGMAAQTPLLILIHHLGWRHSLFAVAGFGLVLWVLILFFVKDYPDALHDQVQEEKRHLKSQGFMSSILVAVKSLQNWLAGIYGNILSLPVVLFGAVYGNAYLVNVFHLTNIQASLVCSSIYLGTIIGSPVFGMYSDHLLRRRFPMFLGAGVCTILFVLLQWIEPHSLYALLGIFFSIGFFSGSQSIAFALVTESNPSNLIGASQGVTSTLIMFAGVVFQPLFGYVLDTHQLVTGGSHHDYPVSAYHDAMWIYPIVFFATFLSVFLIKETYCKSLQSHHVIS